MKKIFFIFLLFILTGNLFAQYAELHIYPSMKMGEGYRASFDDGKDHRQPDSKVDKSGIIILDSLDKTKAREWFSPVQVLNYFYSQGWELVQVFPSPAFRSYMLKKIKK